MVGLLYFQVHGFGKIALRVWTSRWQPPALLESMLHHLNGEAEYNTCKDGVTKLPARSRAEAATLMRPLNQFPGRLLILEM